MDNKKCKCGNTKHRQAKRCMECFKKYMSESQIGNKRKSSTKHKISKKLKGRKFSDEHKEKLSKAKKGKGLKYFFVKKYGIIAWEKHCDENLRGKNHPQFGLTGETAIAYGRKLSDDTKAKISKARLNYLEVYKPYMSKPERTMEKVLKDNNIKYMRQIRIENKLFDFYLPDHNVIIEVDGRYWHNLENAKENDKIKNSICKSNGYKIIRVWEDEIFTKWRII
jgi:very-short-patch-repair endonuclease